MARVISLFLKLSFVSSIGLWCSNSQCTSCNQGLLYNSSSCLSICPSGYEKSFKNCSKVASLSLFRFSSVNPVPFDSRSLETFYHPEGLELKDGGKKSPVMTKDRGLYFKNSSILISNTSWVLAPDFTVSLILRILDEGLIFQVKNKDQSIFRLNAKGSDLNSSILIYNNGENKTFTLKSNRNDLWNTITFVCSQSATTLCIIFQGISYCYQGPQFRSQLENLTYLIGNSEGLSFSGFLYAGVMLNQYDPRVFIANRPESMCGYNQYSLGFTCEQCSNECSDWPWCVRGSCNLCFSVACTECSNYYLGYCLKCSSGEPPYCEPTFKCLSGDFFRCSLCEEGYVVVKGICTLEPYKYNEENLLAPVINTKFNNFQQFYDILQSGENASTFAPYNNSENDDPFPVKSRGLAFLPKKKNFLKSSLPIVFSPEFSLVTWINFQNFGGMFSKEFIEFTDKMKWLVTLYSHQEINKVITTDHFYKNWIQYGISLKIVNNSTSVYIKINNNYAESNTVKGSHYSDSNTNFYIGNYAGGSFEGFIYSFTLWQTYLSSTSFTIDACGSGLNTECLWNSNLNVFLNNVTMINNYCRSSCTQGCSTFGRCNSCYLRNCSMCSSYENDAICYETITENLCISPLQARDDENCCHQRCLSCYGEYSFTCYSCDENFVLHGTACLLSCPTGFVNDKGKCIQKDELLIDVKFNGILAKFEDSVNKTIFQVANESLFYPNYSPFNPIPARYRGYYFGNQSSIKSYPMTLSYNFSANIWILLFNDGKIFSKGQLIVSSNFLELLKIFYIKSGMTISSNWQVLTFTVKTFFYGRTDFILEVYNNVIYMIFSRYYIIFEDVESSLILGSSSNSFQGFIYRVKIHNRIYYESTYSESLSTCNISTVFLNNSCIFCRPECKNGCISDKNCSLCINPLCELCSNFTDDACNKCSNVSYLQGGKCLCNNGTYWDENTWKCEKCVELCQTCNGSSRFSCLSCKEYSSLQNDYSCICDDGYYLDELTSKCEACSENCKTCLSAKAFCTSCHTYYYLKDNMCFCIDGYFLNTNYCEVCHKTCKTCSGPSSLDCLTCDSRSYIDSNSSCKCLPHYFMKFDKCISCFKTCQTCSDDTYQNCTSCIEGLNLQDNGECKCSTPFYWDGNINKCIKCSESCLLCNSFEMDACLNCSDDCLFCQNNSVYINETCKCIAGYFESNGNCDRCDENCYTCTDKFRYSCESCHNNRVLAGGMCIEYCPLGFLIKNGMCEIAGSEGKVMSFEFNNYAEIYVDNISKFKLIKIDFEDLNITFPKPQFSKGLYFNGMTSGSQIVYSGSEPFLFSNEFLVSFWLNPLAGQGSLLETLIKDINSVFFSLMIDDFQISLKLLIEDNLYTLASGLSLTQGQWSILGISLSHRSPTSISVYINSETQHFPNFSQAPLIVTEKSSTFIGFGENHFFKGFIYKIELKRETTFNSLSKNNCIDCPVCMNNGYCLSNCTENQYFDESSKQCKACLEICHDGCRHFNTCGMCFDSRCLKCKDFEIGSCLACQDGFQLDKGICVQCSEMFYFNLSSKLCQKCKGLCTTCLSDKECLSCKENANLLGKICSCSLGYFLNATICERVTFDCNIEISLNNSVQLLFSEPLNKSLEEDDIKVYIDGKPSKFIINSINFSKFSVICQFDKQARIGSYIKIEFIKPIISKRNSLLITRFLNIGLFPINDDIKVRIENVRKIANQGSTVGASVSLCLSVASFDASTLFNFVSFAEMYSIISLYGLELDQEILEFLRNVRVQKSLPNIFSNIEDKNLNISLDQVFVEYGYLSNSSIINSGVNLLALIIIFIFFLVVRISVPVFLTKIEKLKIIWDYFHYTIFIKFWLQSAQDFLITSFYALYHGHFKTIFLFLDYCWSAIIIVLSKQIINIIAYMISVKLVSKKLTLDSSQSELFDKKFGSLYNEFKSEKFIQLCFYLVFFFRRLTLTIVIFCIQVPILRLTFSFTLSLMVTFTQSLFYLLSTKCFKSKMNNFLHIANEILTAFCHLILFLSLTRLSILQGKSTEICIACVTISWLMNIFFSIIKTVLFLIEKIKKLKLNSKVIGAVEHVTSSNEKEIVFEDLEIEASKV